MSGDIDAFLKETMDLVAKNNKIILSMDDPLMIIVTMQQHLLQNAVAVLNEAQNRFLEELEFNLAKTDKEVTAKTEKILTVVVSTHKKALAEGRKELKDTVDSAIKDFAPLCQALAKERRENKKRSWVNFGFFIFNSFCLVILGITAVFI